MMTFRSSVLPILLLILSLTQIDASQNQSLRQKRQNVCPTPLVDACLFVNCENGGTCIQDLTTTDCYQCQCPIGYSGNLCETTTPILPVGCSPGCLNGGICNSNICQCPPEYSGSLCQTRNYCLPTNPCQNGGRCISTATTSQCDCTSTGYTGTICADAIITDPCISNPCQNGGQCSSNGGTFSCFCINGYTGSLCQIPNPCGSITCENGGQCQEIATNVYGCQCPVEFTGARCETTVLSNHVCVRAPTSVCFNGGECMTNQDDYTCKCATGWAGRNCETPLTANTCNPNPCVRGTCFAVNRPGGLTAFCDCDNGWTGKWCDVDLSASCPAGYCLSGGTCLLSGNTPYCQCLPSYTGTRCETLVVGPTIPTTVAPVSTCAPNPCSNGGTCYLDANNIATCSCLPTWTGPRCETLEILTTVPTLPPGGSFCASNPCQNGGTCYENIDMYRCDCVQPWSGLTCAIWSITIQPPVSTPITPGLGVCSPNPCANGGICYPSGSSFTCACQAPYTGILCETIGITMPPLTTPPGGSTACASQPCRNGGTCVPTGTSYSCFCGLDSAYTGQNCDTTAPMPVNECPLNCAPGRCIFSGYAARPYACLWNGIMRPKDGTTA